MGNLSTPEQPSELTPGGDVRSTRTFSMSPDSDLVHATVRDVVVRLPKTLPADACLAAARSALEDDHVHMLLLTIDGRLVGTIVRGDLPHADPGGDDTEGAAPALPYAVMEGRTVSDRAAAEETRRTMIRRGQRRLAVIDDQRTLLGLLCLKRRLRGFCSDTDVEARAADPAAGRARAQIVADPGLCGTAVHIRAKPTAPTD